MKGVVGAIALMAGTANCAQAQSLSDVVFPQPGNEAVGVWATEITPGSAGDPAVNAWTSTVVAVADRARETGALSASPAGLLKAHDGRKAFDADPLSGIASFYGAGVGERTATGETFDPMGFTAAHRTLPFGTRVKVVRVDNGDSVVVRINDRGPFKPGRVIDLSQGAAENLGMTTAGLANVRLEVLDK